MQFVYVGTVSNNEPYGKTATIYIQANVAAKSGDVQDHYMLHLDGFGLEITYEHVIGTIQQAFERATQFINSGR
jgi:hypothetical protein